MTWSGTTRVAWLLFFVAAIISVDAVAKGKLYRWADENGEVYYSDQVPPQHSKHKRTELNERGLTVKVYEGAKTKQQFKKEQRLAKLRVEQRKLIADQRDRDSALVRTFRNVEEIELALKGQLSTLDVLIKIEHANMHRLKVKLDKKLADAAQTERNGYAVAKKQIDEINSLRSQIRDHERSITKHTAGKRKLKTKFSRDISRFVALKSGPQEFGAGGSSSNQLNEINNKEDSIVISLYVCPDRNSCDKAWSLARSYVKAYATRPLEVDTNLLMITKPPHYDDDISISVARIRRQKQSALIFLDVRCKDSSLGRELCLSLKTRSVLAGFSPFLKTGVASMSQAKP